MQTKRRYVLTPRHCWLHVIPNAKIIPNTNTNVIQRDQCCEDDFHSRHTAIYTLHNNFVSHGTVEDVLFRKRSFQVVLQLQNVSSCQSWGNTFVASCSIYLPISLAISAFWVPNKVFVCSMDTISAIYHLGWVWFNQIEIATLIWIVWAAGYLDTTMFRSARFALAQVESSVSLTWWRHRIIGE